MLTLLVLLALAQPPADAPLPEAWEYGPAMRKLAEGGKGKPGVVLHVGDSITYANPYGQWARYGKGQTASDKATLNWLHTGKDDDTDGWHLARFDDPAGGRSHTAASGLRANQLLTGGVRGMSSLAQMLDKYSPQAIVLLIGTNDVSANRDPDAYRVDLAKLVGECERRRVVCVLSTLPPHPSREKLVSKYNESIRGLAQQKKLPLIDLEREILTRREKDWNGTLLGKDDVHPSVNGEGDVNAASEPTADNLRSSGYLLRGWLSVRKLAEVKVRVFD